MISTSPKLLEPAAERPSASRAHSVSPATTPLTRNPGGVHAFLAELLAEQSRLDTPVVAASRAYTQSRIETPPSKIFESLIPLTRPRAGEQYAFEVDLDACTGCKACVSACHALNGLDEDETWRDTGQLLGCASDSPVVQTITTACHHCADPGCLNGCPVLAYEKDPLTGIVRHLDDQCIGCQYCVLKCPYDVPKYNARLGIVRKCDLCHQRLAHGEAPACAQACPTQAIRVVVVTAPKDAPVALREEPRKPSIAFPGADPTYTRPTTRYVSARELPADLRAADAGALRPQPAHWPLVLMLTLLPWAICLQALRLTPLAAGAPAWVALAPLALGALGLAAATFHLGQPLRAWRVFLGLRTSWFSREAVLFGAWFGGTAVLALAPWLARWPALSLAAPLVDSAPVRFGVPFVGLAGFACSVMIYVDTRRSFWRGASTAPRFLLGGALLAFATISGVASVSAAGSFAHYAKLVAILLLGTKLAIELASLRGGSTSARLQRGLLFGALCVRLGLAAGAVVVFAFVVPAAAEPDLAYYARSAAPLVLLLAGEIAERYLFFRAVDAPKMPGYATR